MPLLALLSVLLPTAPAAPLSATLTVQLDVPRSVRARWAADIGKEPLLEVGSGDADVVLRVDGNQVYLLESSDSGGPASAALAESPLQKKGIPGNVLQSMLNLAASELLTNLQSGDARRRAKVELLPADASCEPIDGAVANVLRVGDSVVLRVTLEGEPSYVSIVSTDAAGRSQQIFPIKDVDDTGIRSPGVIFEECVTVESDRAATSNRFFGETVRAYASAEPLAIDMLLLQATLGTKSGNTLGDRIQHVNLASPSVNQVTLAVGPPHCATWSNDGKSLPARLPVPSSKLALGSAEFARVRTQLGNAGDLKRVMDNLAAALRERGYLEQSFYRMPGACGVALVTRLERFQSDGRPYGAGKRFLPPGQDPTADGLDLLRVVQSLFYADPAKYRLLVFAVADRPLEYAAGRAATNDWGVALLNGGEQVTPNAAGEVRLDERFVMSIAVYEFLKESKKADVTAVVPGLGIGTHLRGTQLESVVRP